MPIHIEIHSSDMETRNKRGGGTYQVQKAFVHTVDRNGEPKRYPEEFAFFPPKDNQGNPLPYSKGDYTLDPSSIRVANGFLELGFPKLIPLKK